MNYYEILNVSKDASVDEIKKQYKKLALKHHPDRGGDPEMFKKISEAYQTLSDPEKKEEYDNPNPFPGKCRVAPIFTILPVSLILWIQILFFSSFSITISSNNLHNTCSIHMREIPPRPRSIYGRLQWAEWEGWADFRKACRRKFTEIRK